MIALHLSIHSRRSSVESVGIILDTDQWQTDERSPNLSGLALWVWGAVEYASDFLGWGRVLVKIILGEEPCAASHFIGVNESYGNFSSHTTGVAQLVR